MVSVQAILVDIESLKQYIPYETQDARWGNETTSGSENYTDANSYIHQVWSLNVHLKFLQIFTDVRRSVALF